MPVPFVKGPAPLFTSDVLYVRKLSSHITRINVRSPPDSVLAAPLPCGIDLLDRRFWPPALTIRAKGGNLLAKYENLILVSERSGPVRVPPLPADKWDDDVDHALSGILSAERRNPEDAGNLLATLVRHPTLTRAFLRFNTHLLFSSTLPPRLRELAVLRVAHVHSCEYEWRHHVNMGREAGLTDADIDAIQRGEATDGLDRAVLNAVDELGEKSAVSDATWTALSEKLDERQLMDLVFTIGCYGALAMAINTFGIEPDQER
jgi:4-carboxymuconolactone decarboxylase